jgi:Holliday junction resolvase RusA-like endonuclease
MKLNIEILLKGRACPRPRRSRGGGVFMPKPYKDWKKQVVELLQNATDVRDIELCEVKMLFLFAKPKRLKKTLGRVPRGTKPDTDNLAKGLLDALQDSGIIKDDKLVYKMTACKMWKSEEESECMQIIISTS